MSNSTSTSMLKTADVKRDWYVLDAAGKSLGRVAAAAAKILMGKNKVTYTPHIDNGDHVIIINCEKAVLTGNKATQKYHYRHTGYVGNLKSIRYDALMREKPTLAMKYAVQGMLPKSRNGREQLTRLRVIVGSNHEHEAQKPVPYEF